MIDSYFFIPGDKPNYLSKIDKINADYIVIDLEDAVSINNKQSAIELVLALKFNKNMFLRIPFFDNCYTNDQLKSLILKFEGQIVLPKINFIEDINNVILISEGIPLKMIILIENPKSFIATEEILKVFSNQIHAIGFGSHDFCSLTGIKHTLEHLAHYKRQLILYAKAFNVAFLDGVDLNLINFDQFRKECVFAFESGADGKFIIHPLQLEELQKVDFMKEEEINQLKAVYEKIKDVPINDVDVFKIEGKVYEKPHLVRIKWLVEKMQKKHNNNLN
ncbi:MAG: HpcH/HpaI aldolase/citrate lyase family protein [Flavobacterium sp.]|uniref:HpcH/HpaI aldolase/citrate lyase family protein n=1 Tax=Flavobacterium sp. TaxID=239 RepID=UPI003BC8CB60